MEARLKRAFDPFPINNDYIKMSQTCSAKPRLNKNLDQELNTIRHEPP